METPPAQAGGTFSPSTTTMDKILYRGLRISTGRNGQMKSTGLVVRPHKDGDAVELVPLSSRMRDSTVGICLPDENIPELIKVLKNHLKNTKQ